MSGWQKLRAVAIILTVTIVICAGVLQFEGVGPKIFAFFIAYGGSMACVQLLTTPSPELSVWLDEAKEKRHKSKSE